jgi:restriction endonuclease S subunit
MKQQTQTKQLPKGWIKSKIGNVAKVRYGKGLREDLRSTSGKIPVYASAGRVGYHDEALIKHDTIIIGRKGSIGNNFLVKEPSWAIDTVYYLENMKIDINYLFYTLNFSIVKDTSTAIPSLRREELEAIDIAFPESKQLQSQIVSAIETQFSRLEEAVKVLKSVKEKLKIYRMAVLKKAFEKKEDWEEILVKEMGEIVTGKTPKTSIKEYYGGNFCFFKPGDLDGGYNINDSNTKLSKEGASVLNGLPKKSVMVTCIGATIGKTGLNRVEGATNQQINSIIVNKDKFIPEFLYYLFISELGQRKVIDNSSSTTLPILNKGRFEKLEFILPLSLKIQQKIVSSIESKFSVIDKVEEIVNQSLIKAEMLRKSILKSAFEGKLVKI